MKNLKVNLEEIKTLEKDLKVMKISQITTIGGALTIGIGTAATLIANKCGVQNISDYYSTIIGLTGTVATTILGIEGISYTHNKVDKELELSTKKRVLLKQKVRKEDNK